MQLNFHDKHKLTKTNYINPNQLNLVLSTFLKSCLPLQCQKGKKNQRFFCNQIWASLDEIQNQFIPSYYGLYITKDKDMSFSSIEYG